MDDASIGYTVEFEVKEGQVDAFKQKAAEAIELVEKHEPDTLMYEWFVAEDGQTARSCEWFTDSEGAIAHLTGPALTKLLPGLLESAEITNVEVFGTPSEKLAEMLSDFPVSGPYDHIGGFTR